MGRVLRLCSRQRVLNPAGSLVPDTHRLRVVNPTAYATPWSLGLQRLRLRNLPKPTQPLRVRVQVEIQILSARVLIRVAVGMDAAS